MRERSDEYRVYVVQNVAGRYYIGMSDDIQRRVIDHNNGVSTWTRHRGPWRLVWASEALAMDDARRLENVLKRQKGGAGFFARTGLKKPGS